MKITITCEDCGERHKLERNITQPGQINIVCHSCETPLAAMLEQEALPRNLVAPAPNLSAWNELFDMSQGAPAA